ncbi:hypothetical protein [Helicobacter cinaedi]|uniref:hypothetical protein n=1 Tax=Helicobacter cinaedi TaxID=213 RepID=UPI00059D6593|nr:hypothetical protein [Helicobacter cinaedi]AWK62339.1 hypothetical protein C6B36_08345 [Helicobacter cinaedi]QOQ97026.1 hypothetical protein HW245_05180 [Helicobacter cinaedi]BBB20784.1 tRNA dimethylallyltransferase [Helicobacter cinaedi]
MYCFEALRIAYLAFLQGKLTSLESLKQELFFHTCQLAKRQATFNRTQFPKITLLPKQDLQKKRDL